ncbi:unnamed protein product [Owenia fusiformis]|uniref:Uncharacterized protein n=1 Tax=Owenia fusiformis TaxID=6347 RepID=A0A8J1XIN3_OWEFU|nr:unnamed protein product [Owenia fusiformis]
MSMFGFYCILPEILSRDNMDRWEVICITLPAQCIFVINMSIRGLGIRSALYLLPKVDDNCDIESCSNKEYWSIEIIDPQKDVITGLHASTNLTQTLYILHISLICKRWCNRANLKAMF